MTTTMNTASRFSEDSVEERFQLFIDGKWVDGGSGETFRCIDPFDGREWGHVAGATADDVARAVRAARRAFDGGWSSTPPVRRAQLLRRIADVVDAHVDELT